jgi:hypothetical protein
MAQAQPDMDAFIQALTAAFAANAAVNVAAAAAIPPAPPIPQVPPQFALLPGEAYTDPLDYNKPNELKIFKSATAGMSDKFDLKEQHLRVFLETVREQARTYDWIHVITVPDVNGIGRNLTTNYGQVTRENVQAHAITYIGNPDRNAQNAMMLYKYLMNSLTDEAKLTMLTMKEQYHIGIVPDGIMLLKAIIGRASIDTRAKVLLLRESISHLYIKMNEVKGNVREFNEHVSELSAALRGRGHDVEELVMHLFKAYEQVPDQQFNRYIEAIRDRYDAEIEDITADRLMQLAVTKYDLIAQRNMMPTDTNVEKIVALQAKVNEMNSDKKERRKRFKPKDSWKLIPPKAGEPQVKVASGRTYHYCQYHQQWTAHSPAICTRNPAHQKNEPTTNQASPGNQTADADKLIINKAYHAIVHEDESETDD